MIASSKFFTGILIGASCFASTALADLVLVPTGFEVPINGTGFGNVSTLITVQITSTMPGAGKSGFVFELTPNEATAVDWDLKFDHRDWRGLLCDRSWRRSRY